MLKSGARRERVGYLYTPRSLKIPKAVLKETTRARHRSGLVGTVLSHWVRACSDQEPHWSGPAPENKTQTEIETRPYKVAKLKYTAYTAKDKATRARHTRLARGFQGQICLTSCIRLISCKYLLKTKLKTMVAEKVGTTTTKALQRFRVQPGWIMDTMKRKRCWILHCPASQLKT